MPKPPPPPRKPADVLLGAISERDAILAQIKQLQEREMQLRKFIFAQSFAKPKEGTNRVLRPDGIEIVGKLDVRRKILPDQFALYRGDLLKRGVPLSRVVEMEPRLVLKEYRALTEHHRKAFDRVLEIKPSETPQLEIVL